VADRRPDSCFDCGISGAWLHVTAAKHLKIMADMAIMQETLTHLVRNAIPACGKFRLTINHVYCEIEVNVQSIRVKSLTSG
jgi:hypothetical protein